MPVTPNSVVLPQTLNIGVQNFIEGTDSAGVSKIVWQPGANGGKCVSIIMTSDDGTAAHICPLFLVRSATAYYVGTINVPINAGADGAVATASFLDNPLLPGLPRDNDGQPYLVLENGDRLQVSFSPALTSGKKMDVVAFGSDF